MSIYLTDDIEVKTKKGKMGGAKQIFLEGDTQTVEKEIKDINSRHDTLSTKHESLSKTVQGISATGKANTATEVTYNSTNSGIVAENIQDAVDKLAAKDATKAEKSDVQASVSELKAKNTLQDAEIAKKANSVDVTSQMQTEHERVNTELDKKFNTENISKELGDSEEKVLSQKVSSDKISMLTSEIVRSEISIEETVENQYMLSTKTIKADSIYKAYSMDYYPVEPNKFFRIISTAKGIDVATIALLANKEATEALSVYDVSKGLDDIVNADRVLLIPEGVSYVAVSRNKAYTSKCYLVGEGENRFDVLEKDKANKTDMDDALFKKFDNNKILNSFGTKEDAVLNQRLVSFYLNDLYFRKTLLNAESTEAAYFDDKLVKINDRFNAYDLNFYKVEEGQSICVKGSSSGKIVAIALLSDKENLKAIEGYGFPSDDNIVDANAVIVIPSGITYIALSKRKTKELDAYLVEKDSRIDDLESSKAEKSDVQSSVSTLIAKNTSQDEEIAKKANATDVDSQIQTEQKRVDAALSKKFDNKLYGKTLLMIGDSVTAQGFIQNRIGELLGMNIRTHAKGGIGIIQMVDGDGSGDAPEGYDPDSFGTDIIYRLNETDVKDVSIIIVFGFYNERTKIRTSPGETGDMYPTQDTFIGRLNYAIKRIYEELNKAKNTDCRIIICTAHRFGHYPYSSYSSYDDGDKICKYTLETANYNSLPCIDVMHNGGINEYNWNLFQKSSTDYNENYIPSDNVKDATNKPWTSLDIAPAAATNKGKLITVGTTSNYTTYKSDGTNWVKDISVYPWYGDHLHLNASGGKILGNYIAAQLLSL